LFKSLRAKGEWGDTTESNVEAITQDERRGAILVTENRITEKKKN